MKPSSVQCGAYRAESAEPCTLTITNCPDMEQELLPLDITVPRGEVQFEYPYAIWVDMGVCVNVGPLRKSAPDGQCRMNRIRFSELDAGWFPFLEAWAPASARKNVFTLDHNRLIGGRNVFDIPQRRPVCYIEIEESRRRLEYVFCETEEHKSTACTTDQQVGQWCDFRADTEAELPFEEVCSAVPFSIPRAMLESSMASLTREEFIREIVEKSASTRKRKRVSQEGSSIDDSTLYTGNSAFEISTTPPEITLTTLIEPDARRILSIVSLDQTLYIVGADESRKRGHKEVQDFFNLYAYALLETFTKSDNSYKLRVTHDVQIVPHRKTTDKVLHVFKKHAFPTCLVHMEKQAEDETELRKLTLEALGHVLMQPMHFVFVEPLLSSDERKNLEPDIEKDCVQVWEEGKTKCGFTWLDMFALYAAGPSGAKTPEDAVYEREERARLLEKLS